MTEIFWNIRDDLLTAPASVVVAHFWEDDESNRQRSLATFQDETRIVDEGLTLFVGAVQGAFGLKDQWKDDVRMRAGVAMVVYALNSLLAWRHLLSAGYLAEARLFSRSIHESLSQALVFSSDATLAQKFFAGDSIPQRQIRKQLSQALAGASTFDKQVYTEFSKQYVRLSRGAHPTLDSFSSRAAATKPGKVGLAEVVPEGVLIGGFLSEDLGRVAWLALADKAVEALSFVRLVLPEVTGSWDARYVSYRELVARLIGQHDAELDAKGLGA